MHLCIWFFQVPLKCLWKNCKAGHDIFACREQNAFNMMFGIHFNEFWLIMLILGLGNSCVHWDFGKEQI